MSGLLKPSNPWAPALDVEVDVENGATVDVLPLAFVDTDAPTVVVTQQPANGTVTPGGDAPGLLIANLSQEGPDEARYTLTDTRGATSEVAILRLMGVQETPPPPPPDPTGEPGSTGTATAVVSNYSQLSGAIGSAGPGTIIQLSDGGNYSGARLNVSASGTAQNPIVIRAAAILGANVPGGFNVTGSHVIVRGIDFSANVTGTDRCILGGTGSQYWRCRFRYNGGQNNLRLMNGSGGRVMFCRFTVWTPGNNEAPDSRSLGGWIGGNNPHYDAEVGFCYFHDLPSKPNGQPYGYRARSAIGLNNANNNSLMNSNWWIHHCLLVNCGNSRLNVKMSGNLVEFCTITGKNGGNLTYSTDFNGRFGQNNVWRGCWSENADGYRGQGKGHKYISCKSVNPQNPHDIAPGDHDPPPALSGNPRADDVKIVDCDTNLRVGGMGWAGSLPARNTRIEAHVGSVSLISGNHTGTVQVGTTSEPTVTPIKITPAMVGPFGIAAAPAELELRAYPVSGDPGVDPGTPRSGYQAHYEWYHALGARSYPSCVLTNALSTGPKPFQDFLPFSIDINMTWGRGHHGSVWWHIGSNIYSEPAGLPNKEIDLCEYVIDGSNLPAGPLISNGTHGDDSAGAFVSTAVVSAANRFETWNTHSIAEEGGDIVWRTNGTETHRQAAAPWLTLPVMLIIGFEIGGNWPGLPVDDTPKGQPADPTIATPWPARMRIRNLVIAGVNVGFDGKYGQVYEAQGEGAVAWTGQTLTQYWNSAYPFGYNLAGTSFGDRRLYGNDGKEAAAGNVWLGNTFEGSPGTTSIVDALVLDGWPDPFLHRVT